MPMLFVAVVAAAILVGVGVAGSVGAGCQLRERKPAVCVLGGDDAGTGAAWATSSLGVPTLLVLDHRRNLGGDPASFWHDGAEMVPSGGGVNLKMLQSDPSHTNQRTNNNVAGGPRGAFLYYDTLFRTHPLNASLEIVTGYIAQPSSGVVDSGGRPTGLSLLHRNGSSCFVACEYVVDGSPEGWGAAAFGLPVIFGREALTNKSTDDPTVRGEAYAGRRTFAVNGRGPPIESWSDRSVETADVSSASGPITNLCAYGDPAAAVEGAFDPRSPWLLTNPPTNYREEDFVQPWHHLIVDGSCCAAGPECSPQVYRYQGLTMSAEFQQYTGSTGPTLPGWYTLAGKAVGEHYLRIAYANPTKLWDAKRTVELNAFEYAVGALYYVQNNVTGGKKWGFCNSSYPHTNRALSDGGSKDAAIPAGPYMLSDFGTSSNGGDQTVAHRLYHRQLARMGSPNPVGAAMLYDGESRLPHPWTQNAPTPAAAGAGPNTKKYFEPESVAIALYGTDFTKGVLGNLVPRPAANASGDGVLFGNAPNGGNMHGIHPRMLFPDEKATEESVRGNGGRPPAGNFTRTFVHNYLSPGTPRSTFMLQASARIGCFANNLGVAAGVFAAWAKKLNTTTSRIPTMLVQYTLAADLDTAITFYKPPLAMNGPTYAALMISGAYAVPPSLDFGGLDPEETAVSSTELASWLASYKEGILTGSITPPPPQPPPPPPPHPPPSPPNPPKDLGCITGANNASWYAYIPDWDFGTNTSTAITAVAKPSYNCAKGALLKRCSAKSTFLPPNEVKCFAPGTVIKIKSPARATSVRGERVLEPIFEGSNGMGAAPAVREDLANALDAIHEGTSSLAIAAPSVAGSNATLPFTIAELAHVVTRHAAVIRELLHNETILTPLGLFPYTFHGNV